MHTPTCVNRLSNKENTINKLGNKIFFELHFNKISTMNLKRPITNNLGAMVRGFEVTDYQKALAMDEYEAIIEYCNRIERQLGSFKSNTTFSPDCEECYYVKIGENKLSCSVCDNVVDLP